MLTTDDRISHALTMDNAFSKGTACGRVFIAWRERNEKKHGPRFGVVEPLPDLHKGIVDCMTCIVKSAVL